MALIKKPSKEKPLSVIVKMPEKLLQDIKAYCDWQGIEETNRFLIEAVAYVLKMDKDWARYKGQQKQAAQTITKEKESA